MKCSICGQPIRVIPTGSKLKDAYNKVALVIGRCCMRCALAYKDAVKEAENMTYEERAEKTLERMKSQGMSQEQIRDAIKQADMKEYELEINKIKQEHEEVIKKEENNKIKQEGVENKMVEGYCMKEKQTRKMVDVKEEKNARGIMVAKGKCEKCGTKMYKILGNK